MKKLITTAAIIIVVEASMLAAASTTLGSPLASESMEKRFASVTVRNNLIQIGALADTYFKEKKEMKEVTVSALRQWLPGALRITVVDAEDYDVIVVPRGWKILSITTKGGLTVTYERKEG